MLGAWYRHGRILLPSFHDAADGGLGGLFPHRPNTSPAIIDPTRACIRHVSQKKTKEIKTSRKAVRWVSVSIV
jgi:hypothetical protein